jgi:hypothetical protein
MAGGHELGKKADRKNLCRVPVRIVEFGANAERTACYAHNGVQFWAAFLTFQLLHSSPECYFMQHLLGNGDLGLLSQRDGPHRSSSHRSHVGEPLHVLSTRQTRQTSYLEVMTISKFRSEGWLRAPL